MNAYILGQFQKNNCLETQKSLLELYKKTANIEPDISLRFGAIPVFPLSISSPSHQNLAEAKIVQIFLFIHPSYLNMILSSTSSSLKYCLILIFMSPVQSLIISHLDYFNNHLIHHCPISFKDILHLMPYNLSDPINSLFIRQSFTLSNE